MIYFSAKKAERLHSLTLILIGYLLFRNLSFLSPRTFHHFSRLWFLERRRIKFRYLSLPTSGFRATFIRNIRESNDAPFFPGQLFVSFTYVWRTIVSCLRPGAKRSAEISLPRWFLATIRFQFHWNQFSFSSAGGQQMPRCY